MGTLTLLNGMTICLVGYSHDSQSATEAKDAADTVYTNGKIYTVNEAQPADMIVLDQNLFEIDSKDIDETRVLQTIMDGKIVYDRGNQGDGDVYADDMLDRMQCFVADLISECPLINSNTTKLHGGLLFSVDWWYRFPVWHLHAV